MATRKPQSKSGGKPPAKPAPGRKAPRARSAAADEAGESPGVGFPIVGIGCSAGGLDALEKFFRHTPDGSGMAFVVVQHLAPGHTSSLPDLLQRATRMPVAEVDDGISVRRNCIYVIPPGKDLSLLQGRLHLLDPVEPRGQRLPIDFFLRSLAEDQREKAIGIVLSGMGSDGMFGLSAIKAKAGLTLVQQPESATAASMPSSAIQAGVADIVAPPEELPARIIAYYRHPTQLRPAEPAVETAIQSDLEKIIVLLRERSGADFSLYKSSTLLRRIERRIALHQFADAAEYVHHLRENPQEIDLLFRELLIGVTSFFRDAEVWEYLAREAIPALLAKQPGGKPIRAWVPACSRGEEAYSLAMVFKEAMQQSGADKRCEVLIYATDLDPDAIGQARRGVFPENIGADVSPDRLERFFVREDNGFRIRKDIREMVVFAPQNVISDPPFTKLDILSCRNLLIYFRAQLQRTLLPLFHYALNRDGLLLLGTAESIGSFSQLFTPVNNKLRLYRRLDKSLPVVEIEFPVGSAQGMRRPVEASPAEDAQSLSALTDKLIQQDYAPAAVLVTAEGDILYISGRTGKYLEPAAGKVNMNIHAMAREGLREALTGVIHQALRETRPVHLHGVQVGTNGGRQTVDITVQAIDKPEPLRGRLLIVFKDLAPLRTGKRKSRSVASETHEALERELQQTREALQVTHEEMQTSMEELKSSNEELQSTNEELQSTNEELTTSKEEMQSMNEELQTVNAELQSKITDLTWVRNDMANLLNSTEIATVFLDLEMNLRRFTPHATKLFKVIPGDLGRPLSHIVSELDYPRLGDDARAVLATLTFQEKQIRTHDGHWYRVRIMPYRTQDNVIDGVVMTFTDIDELKKLQDHFGDRVAD